MPSPPNKAADKGNIVHKALELLARQKVAQQNHCEYFTEPETKKRFFTQSFTAEQALNHSWNYYLALRQGINKFTPADRQECWGSIQAVLLHNEGQFDPRQRHVVAPEHYFDITFAEPWARYDFTLPDGKRISGQLSVKGTVDLATEVNANTLEYIDYKTGARKDWATDGEKTPQKLRKDPQLLLYHLALRHDFPQYQHIIMTIFFTKDGGPFSFPFNEQDVVDAKNMIRKRFEKIKSVQRPQLLLETGNKPWWCKHVCHFGKTLMEGTGSTICRHVRNDLIELGMDRVVHKYADLDKLTRYGEGGGRT